MHQSSGIVFLVWKAAASIFQFNNSLPHGREPSLRNLLTTSLIVSIMTTSVVFHMEFLKVSENESKCRNMEYKSMETENRNIPVHIVTF